MSQVEKPNHRRTVEPKIRFKTGSGRQTAICGGVSEPVKYLGTNKDAPVSKKE